MEWNAVEKEVLNREPLDLLDAALAASGIAAWEELERYRLRTSILLQRFRGTVGADLPPIARARSLFRWLWLVKPRRYRHSSTFLLSQVLDAHFDTTQVVEGNCLGFTQLYNVLGKALGLRVGIVHIDEAFGQGPHVLSALYLGNGDMDVENIFHRGFDYKGHLDRPGREIWGDRELVADVYLSRGNLNLDIGNLEQATEDYEKALQLNPRYDKAHLNRGIALAALDRETEALKSLGEVPVALG